MQTVAGMPRGAAIAVDDMLDHCANIKAGQEVVLLAHVDGTCGGDSLVDPQVIAWLPEVLAVAAKYPGRPGVNPVPRRD